MFGVCNLKKKETHVTIIFAKEFPRKTNQIIFADNQYSLSWARIRASLTTQQINIFRICSANILHHFLDVFMHYYLGRKKRAAEATEI